MNPGNISQCDEVLRSECKKCNAPLGHESKLEGFHLCREHRFCQVCHASLSPTETRIPFQTDETHGMFICHIHCSPFAPSRMIPDSTVEITQSHLDYLNAYRLVLEPQVELSIEGNRQSAALASRRLITEMSPDTLLMLVARTEMFMADVSVALSRKMVSVKAIQSERDAERFVEVEENRNAPSTPKQAKKKLNRDAQAAKVLDGVLGKDLAMDFMLKMQAALRDKKD